MQTEDPSWEDEPRGQSEHPAAPLLLEHVPAVDILQCEIDWEARTDDAEPGTKKMQEPAPVTS